MSVLTVQRAEYRQGDVLHERRPGARFLHVSGPYVAGRTASLSGTPLELTPKEFDLLHLLARQPGRAYSREYLLQRIWGLDYDGVDHSVDAIVVRLRKKLGPFGDHVVTVWGVAYKLRAD